MAVLFISLGSLQIKDVYMYIVLISALYIKVHVIINKLLKCIPSLVAYLSVKLDIPYFICQIICFSRAMLYVCI